MKPLFLCLTLIVALNLPTPSALAQNVDNPFVDHTPFEIPGGKYVTAEEAKHLWDQKAMFVDTRVSEEYRERTIKGAINIVYKEQFARTRLVGSKDEFDLAALPADKNQPLVFFCNGSPCWKGYKAALKAIAAGYTQVHWYRDGLPDWTKRGYPTQP